MPRVKKSKYPPYPASNRDYAVIESARQQLVKPNKAICIYCRKQAPSENSIIHAGDCPVGGVGTDEARAAKVFSEPPKSKTASGKLREKLPKNAMVEEPVIGCKACMSYPCVCEQDAEEARQQREEREAAPPPTAKPAPRPTPKPFATLERVAEARIPETKTHTLVHPERGKQQCLFVVTEGEDTVVLKLPKQVAQRMYAQLLRYGWTKF